jgi:hypothetical protein
MKNVLDMFFSACHTDSYNFKEQKTCHWGKNNRRAIAAKAADPSIQNGPASVIAAVDGTP